MGLKETVKRLEGRVASLAMTGETGELRCAELMRRIEALRGQAEHDPEARERLIAVNSLLAKAAARRRDAANGHVGLPRELAG